MSKFSLSILLGASVLAYTPAKSTGAEVATGVVAAVGVLYEGGKFAYNVYANKQFCKYLCNGYTCAKGAITTIKQPQVINDVAKLEQDIESNPQVEQEVKDTIKNVKSQKSFGSFCKSACQEVENIHLSGTPHIYKVKKRYGKGWNIESCVKAYNEQIEKANVTRQSKLSSIAVYNDGEYKAVKEFLETGNIQLLNEFWMDHIAVQ